MRVTPKARSAVPAASASISASISAPISALALGECAAWASDDAAGAAEIARPIHFLSSSKT